MDASIISDMNKIANNIELYSELESLQRKHSELSQDLQRLFSMVSPKCSLIIGVITRNNIPPEKKRVIIENVKFKDEEDLCNKISDSARLLDSQIIVTRNKLIAIMSTLDKGDVKKLETIKEDISFMEGMAFAAAGVCLLLQSSISLVLFSVAKFVVKKDVEVDKVVSQIHFARSTAEKANKALNLIGDEYKRAGELADDIKSNLILVETIKKDEDLDQEVLKLCETVLSLIRKYKDRTRVDVDYHTLNFSDENGVCHGLLLTDIEPKLDYLDKVEPIRVISEDATSLVNSSCESALGSPDHNIDDNFDFVSENDGNSQNNTNDKSKENKVKN